MGTRKLAIFVLAACMPVGLLVTLAMPGTAWAKAAKGTVSCSSLEATVNFKPPLLPQGTQKETSAIKPITMGGCVSNGSSVTPKKVTATIKVQGTNSCVAFPQNVTSDSLKLVVKWSGASPTTVTFKAGTLSVNNAADGFVASGGKAAGSYKMSGASFSANMSTLSQQQLVSCMGGSGSVESMQIATGSAAF